MGKIKAKDLFDKEDYERIVLVCQIFGVEMNGRNLRIMDNSGKSFGEQRFENYAGNESVFTLARERSAQILKN